MNEQDAGGPINKQNLPNPAPEGAEDLHQAPEGVNDNDDGNDEDNDDDNDDDDAQQQNEPEEPILGRRQQRQPPNPRIHGGKWINHAKTKELLHKPRI